MIWQSTLLMTLFDLAIVGLTGFALFVFLRHRQRFAGVAAHLGQPLVVIGLLCIGLFYLADLLTMLVLPSLVGQAEAMAAMETLHLNYSWVAMFVAVSSLCYGFYRITWQLLGLLEGQRDKELALQRANRLKDAESAVRVAIASMDRPEDICRVIGQISAQLRKLGLDHDSCTIQVIDEEGTGFVSFADDIPGMWEDMLEWLQGAPWPQAEEHSRLHPWVLETWRARRPYYQPAFDLTPPGGDVLQGLSLIDAPFSRGTLGVHKKRPHAFTEGDVELLQHFADQLSLGFRRFLDILERHRSQLRLRIDNAIQRVRNEVLYMQSPDDWLRVGQCLDQQLRQLVPVHDSSIILETPGGKGLHSYYFDSQTGEATPQFSAALRLEDLRAVREAVQTQKPVYRRNRDEIAAYGDVLHEEVNAVVDLPFQNGTLGVNSVEADGFSRGHIAVLVQLTAVLSEAYRRLEDLHRIRQQDQQLLQAQKMEAVGQLTAGMAHNFNNMLQAILGNLYLLQENLEGENGDMAAAAISAAERSATIIQQMLVFAQRDPAYVPKSCKAAAVAAAVVAICRQSFDRIVDLDVELEGDPAFWGDSRQVEQALLNLCINARDALAAAKTPQPRILLRVGTRHIEAPGRPAGPYVCLEVKDNGPGMDQETQRHAFEPFFTTKEVGQGTGLGLSTVYGVAERHKGWIECDSAPGKGAVFTLFLPVASRTDVEPVAAAPAAVGGTETVLLVEDEDVVRHSLELALRKTGYTVLQASDGQQGLETWRRLGPAIDLIIMDESMPVLPGREVLGRLRAEPPYPPVIMLSGYRLDGSDFAGARAVLRKPIKLTELLGCMRRVLDDAAQAAVTGERP